MVGTLYTRRTPASIALNASESSLLSTPVGLPNDAPVKRTSTVVSFTTFFISARNRFRVLVRQHADVERRGRIRRDDVRAVPASDPLGETDVRSIEECLGSCS